MKFKELNRIICQSYQIMFIVKKTYSNEKFEQTLNNIDFNITYCYNVSILFI